MIRTLIVFALGLFISAGAQAQTSVAKPSKSKTGSRFSFTPTVGAIFTTFDFTRDSDGINSTAEGGFAIGLELTLNSSSRYVDYQSGLIYSQSQTRTTGTDSDSWNDGQSWSTSNYQNTIELQRLSIPVAVRVFPWQKSSNFYFKGGLMFNYQMRAKYNGTSTYTEGGLNASSTPEADVWEGTADDGEGLRAIVPDVLVGLGYNINMGKSLKNINAELAYQRGLLGISSVSPSEMTTNTIYLRGGATF